MKRYEGRRTGHAVDVTVDGRPLNPRLDLWNHSPTGFEWGYGGSGPTQLALATVADCLGDDEKARCLYQAFKSAIVANLPFQQWTLTEAQVRSVVGALEER